VGVLDSPAHGEHQPFKLEGDGDLQPHLKVPRFSDETLKEFKNAHDAEVKALKAPQPPEQDLSTSEKGQVGEIVARTKNYSDSQTAAENSREIRQIVDNFDKRDQSRLDLGQSISQLSCQQLQKLFPSINKQLEPLGFRMAAVPELDEVVLGKLNSESGEYEPWNFIGNPTKCPVS
jgi:hypothetical protein